MRPWSSRRRCRGCHRPAWAAGRPRCRLHHCTSPPVAGVAVGAGIAVGRCRVRPAVMGSHRSRVQGIAVGLVVEAASTGSGAVARVGGGAHAAVVTPCALRDVGVARGLAGVQLRRRCRCTNRRCRRCRSSTSAHARDAGVEVAFDRRAQLEIRRSLVIASCSWPVVVGAMDQRRRHGTGSSRRPASSGRHHCTPATDSGRCRTAWRNSGRGAWCSNRWQSGPGSVRCRRGPLRSRPP